MPTLDRWKVGGLAGAVVLGPMAGALVVRKPTMALVLCLAAVLVVTLDLLGDRAMPWFIVGFAVLPWYPMVANTAEPPTVPQFVLCAAIVIAPLTPWLWQVAAGKGGGPRSRLTPLFGLLFVSLFVLVYLSLDKRSDLITSIVAGFLFAGVAFVCARRNPTSEIWLAPCFGGLLALSALGMVAFAAAPDNRVGYFTGHPITYGALIVALLPGAVLWASRRSRSLALGVAALALVMATLSQSRSSWAAAAVILLYLVLLLAVQRRVRTLGLVAAGVALIAAIAMSVGPLHKIISERLAEKNRTSESVTHRAWSVDYAMGQIGRNLVFGAGQPGFAGKQAGDRTGVGALDNGYLTVLVDLGLLGFAALLVPLCMAARMLGRGLTRARADPADIALALGVLGLAVVAAFYDSFYWAQINLLLFAFGGVLSTRFVGARSPSYSLAAQERALTGRLPSLGGRTS